MSQMPKDGSNPEGCLGGIYSTVISSKLLFFLPRVGQDFFIIEISVRERKHLFCTILSRSIKQLYAYFKTTIKVLKMKWSFKAGRRIRTTDVIVENIGRKYIVVLKFLSLHLFIA